MRSISGALVISLDYELMWGVRDHATRESYGPNVLGARKAIPMLLDLFYERGIKATWATVGALLCDSKDELLARAKAISGDGCVLSRLDDIGPDERRDPYYFGASLARLIASCPGQEIGTHTFSHRCALEPGETVKSFSADVVGALAQLREWQIPCKSIVFPRNQYEQGVLAACRSLGLTHFRGTETSWYYSPAPGSRQTKARRACRLIDSYVNFSGPNVTSSRNSTGGPLINVASSRFLRPFSKGLFPLEGLRLRRMERAMRVAAQTGATFHLWWHPENFGTDTSENMSMLINVLDRFERLRDEYGMQSRAMYEIGQTVTGQTSPPS